MLGVRAILPLVIFDVCTVCGFKVSSTQQDGNYPRAGALDYRNVYLNVGLTYGARAIGAQTGSILPAAFMQIGASEFSPLYSEVAGLTIVIVRVLIGFGATLAEPALNALGLTVQNLTNGAFKSRC